MAAAAMEGVEESMVLMMVSFRTLVEGDDESASLGCE